MTSNLSEVLIRLASAVGSAATLRDIYEAALCGVRDATGIDRASIQMLADDGALSVEASSGVSDLFHAASEGCIPRSTGPDALSPVVVPDISAEPSLAACADAFVRERISALAFVPVVSRNEVIGTFALFSDRPYAFTAGEIPAALTIGYQIGFAVERARTSREEAAVRERLTALTDASRRLLTSLNDESVVGEILSLAGAVIAADAYAVWRRDDQDWRVAASRHLSDEFVAQHVSSDMAADATTPVLAEDVMQTPMLDARRAAYAREGIRSLLSIPLEDRGRPAGSIVFYYRARHRPSDIEVPVAVALGHLAAAAMSNARLFTEAQEANRLKDEFLATLSHELRTPLNVILGRTRMLAGVARQPEAVRQIAETIERNGQALARLVDDLLDVSRITLGQVRLDLQPVRMDTIVDAVVAGVEPTARARGVTLTIEPHEPLGPLLVDATRLQQVLWNLLTNAIKFTPSGGRVRVSVTRSASHAVLAVSDTGKGITADFLPHVFDMFRQAEPASTRQYGGLGLGLTIVRRLVELHGGFVTVESEGADRGTTFSVFLPMAVEDGGPGPVEAARYARPAGSAEGA